MADPHTTYLRFSTRLTAAAQEGLLWGVRILGAVLIPALLLGWLATDYLTMRADAQKGRAAFDYLTNVLQQQQKANAPTPQAGTPAPGGK